MVAIHDAFSVRDKASNSDPHFLTSEIAIAFIYALILVRLACFETVINNFSQLAHSADQRFHSRFTPGDLAEIIVFKIIGGSLGPDATEADLE